MDSDRFEKMRKLRRGIAAFFVLLLCASGSGGAVSADFDSIHAGEIYLQTSVDDLKSEAYAVVECTSGDLILSRNGRKHMTPGNLTKLMTLLMTFEAIGRGEISLQTEFPVTPRAQTVSNGRSRVFLDAAKKERITVEQAVIALCICGANDATCALAEYLGGTESNFVSFMQARCTELGLDGTSFSDSTGIDAAQYTCAEDLARIMRRLLSEYPEALPYLNMTYGKFQHLSTGEPDTEMVSTNPLNRKKFFEAADGSMIGFAEAEGYGLCATLCQNDKRVIAVVLGAPDEDTRAAEIRRLLEYSVTNYEFRKICTTGTFVKKVDVRDGKDKRIKTQTASDLSVLLNVKDFDKVKASVELTQELTAPLEADTPVGYVIYSLEDREIGRVELVTAEKMERAGWFVRLIRRILSWFGL